MTNPEPSHRDNLESLFDYGTSLDLATEAEMALIGSMILSPQVINKVALALRPSDISDVLSAIAFDIIVNMHQAGMSIDTEALIYAGKARTQQNFIGFIARCSLCGAPSAIDLYISDVRQLSINRKLRSIAIEFIEDISSDPRSGLTDSTQVAAKMLAKIEHIQLSQENTEVAKLADCVHDCLDEIEKSMTTETQLGMSTGFNTLDAFLGGLFPGELTVVAARPGIGKTAFALQIARHIGFSCGAVVFFSLEMTKSELTRRSLCTEAEVSSERLRNGTVNHNELQKLVAAAQRFQNCKVYIDDKSGRDVTQVCALSKLIHSTDPVSCVVVDYLQILRSTTLSRNREKREQIAEMTMSLKSLAKDLSCPVIVLSQVNRKAAEAGVLHLHNLSEAGSIEQDANNVWFIQRQERDGKLHSVEIDIAKNRSGRVGRRPIVWEPQFTRFSDPVAQATSNHEHDFDDFSN